MCALINLSNAFHNNHKILTEGVSELLGLVALLAGLDNDGLSAGESAGGDNNNLTALDATHDNRHKITPKVSTLHSPNKTTER